MWLEINSAVNWLSDKNLQGKQLLSQPVHNLQ